MIVDKIVIAGLFALLITALIVAGAVEISDTDCPTHSAQGLDKTP